MGARHIHHHMKQIYKILDDGAHANFKTGILETCALDTEIDNNFRTTSIIMYVSYIHRQIMRESQVIRTEGDILFVTCRVRFLFSLKILTLTTIVQWFVGDISNKNIHTYCINVVTFTKINSQLH